MESSSFPVETLLNELQPEKSFPARMAAVKALGQLHETDERIVQALIRIKEADAQVDIQEAAFQALQTPAFQAFLHQFPDLLEQASRMPAGLRRRRIRMLSATELEQVINDPAKYSKEELDLAQELITAQKHRQASEESDTRMTKLSTGQLETLVRNAQDHTTEEVEAAKRELAARGKAATEKAARVIKVLAWLFIAGGLIATAISYLDALANARFDASFVGIGYATYRIYWLPVVIGLLLYQAGRNMNKK